MFCINILFNYQKKIKINHFQNNITYNNAIVNMEDLVTSLVERNIVKLTNIIESTSCPLVINYEYLQLLTMFLIQKAGCSPSPKTIEWLYYLVNRYPEVTREIAESFEDSLVNMKERCPDIQRLYEIKGKLSLFHQVRNEVPDVSTATPEHQIDNSEEESEEINYQEFSVNSYIGLWSRGWLKIKQIINYFINLPLSNLFHNFLLGYLVNV